MVRYLLPSTCLMLESLRNCTSSLPEREVEVEEVIRDVGFRGNVSVRPLIKVEESTYKTLIEIAESAGLIELIEVRECLGFWKDVGSNQRECLVNTAAKTVGLCPTKDRFRGRTVGGMGRVALKNELEIEVETHHAAGE